MDITVELIDQRWCVVMPGALPAQPFHSGAAAFDAAAAVLRDLHAAGREVGRVHVRAFGTSVSPHRG